MNRHERPWAWRITPPSTADLSARLHAFGFWGSAKRPSRATTRLLANLSDAQQIFLVGPGDVPALQRAARAAGLCTVVGTNSLLVAGDASAWQRFIPSTTGSMRARVRKLFTRDRLVLRARRRYTLQVDGWRVDLSSRTHLMGILNVTPDSFSDGGMFQQPAMAVAHAEQMWKAGADLIDVGGESTRPGAAPVPVEEELRRVIPVIEQLARERHMPVSIDTSKAEVAHRALQAGAVMVNDVTAMRGDARMAEVVARWRVPIVLMHMKGTPLTMQRRPRYRSLLGELLAFFQERITAACAAGVERHRIILDPGIGFGKTPHHNLQILQQLEVLEQLGLPVLIGPSRKSFIGVALGLPADQRWEGTAAAVTAAVLHGAQLVRVHDVVEMVRVARMADAIRRGRVVRPETKRVWPGVVTRSAAGSTTLRPRSRLGPTAPESPGAARSDGDSRGRHGGPHIRTTPSSA